VNWRTDVSTSPERIDRESPLVAGVPVRITELVWPDQRRSFEVHLVDGDVDLTADGCFDDPPTDAQIRDLLADHDATITPPAHRDSGRLLRELLTAASTRVGWRVDLHQLPITAAHRPDLVVALLDACAAHVAALATHTALTDAAHSIKSVIADGDPDNIDWFAAELLGAVAGLADRRTPNLGHTHRALIAALRALQADGLAWPTYPA
jgi:hypothetical protein